jgi:DNA polymerase-3 subunit epsilon
MPESSSLFRVAILDTETTGLYPSSDRIIEIAVILVAAEPGTGRVVRELGRYAALQDPGFPIPWGAFAVHGISDAMVKGHAIDAGAVRALLEQAELVVAHNAGFDKGFVTQVLPEAPQLPWACSCRGVPWRTHFPVLNAKLQDLARHFRIQGGTAHRALGDVETTLALLATELPEQDCTALGHLIAKKRGMKARPVAARS